MCTEPNILENNDISRRTDANLSRTAPHIRAETVPTLTAPELLGLATITAWPIVLILVAIYLAPPCTPSDVNTINGTPACVVRR